MDNIYIKLQNIKQYISTKELKKSETADTGKFGSYNYFSFEEIQRLISSACLKEKCLCTINILADQCQLVLVNLENTEQQLQFIHDFTATLNNFTTPASIYSKALQNLGCKVTYLKRYMFIQVFDLCENDPTEQIAVEEEKKHQKELKLQELEDRKQKIIKEKIMAQLAKLEIEGSKAVEYLTENYTDEYTNKDFQAILDSLLLLPPPTSPSPHSK